MSRRAFTLVEVLIALVLVGAVLAIAIPASSGLLARGSRTGAAEVLSGAFREARGIAMREGEPLEIVALIESGQRSVLRARSVVADIGQEPRESVEVERTESDDIDESLGELPNAFTCIDAEAALPAESFDDLNDEPGALAFGGEPAEIVLAVVLPSGRVVASDGWRVREEREGADYSFYDALVHGWTGGVTLKRVSEASLLDGPPAETAPNTLRDTP